MTQGPTREQILSLYRLIIRASKKFKLTDKVWFKERVYLEIKNIPITLDPNIRMKMYEVRIIHNL